MEKIERIRRKGARIDRSGTKAERMFQLDFGTQLGHALQAFVCWSIFPGCM